MALVASALPVMTMMARSGHNFRAASASSMPPISGITMSVRSRADSWPRKWSIASADEAARMHSYPLATR